MTGLRIIQGEAFHEGLDSMKQFDLEISSSGSTDELNGPGLEPGNPNPLSAKKGTTGPPICEVPQHSLTCSIPATAKGSVLHPAVFVTVGCYPVKGRSMAEPERRRQLKQWSRGALPWTHRLSRNRGKGGRGAWGWKPVVGHAGVDGVGLGISLGGFL